MGVLQAKIGFLRADMEFLHAAVDFLQAKIGFLQADMEFLHAEV